jgi:hypothetical protein
VAEKWHGCIGAGNGEAHGKTGTRRAGVGGGAPGGLFGNFGDFQTPGSRLLGGRVRVELKTIAVEKELEADIAKSRWDEIKAAGSETVFLFFSSARIYGANETWSDYSI